MIVNESRTLFEIARFFVGMRRWPSAVASDEHERQLGLWLNRQRLDNATGRMDPFRRTYLQQRLPGWDADPHEIWTERAREASSFLLGHHREPDLESPDAGERAVAVWLLCQRALDLNGDLHPARGGWLDAHCPHWRGPADGTRLG